MSPMTPPLDAAAARRTPARLATLLAWFVLAWGWGEVVGYWAGAGASLRRVR